MYTIYLKEHNKTGKRYLGYTSQDPFVYSGSGIHWKKHLKNHGNDVTTVVLFETEEMEQIREKGLYYSKLFDIVKSEMFLNLKEETGDGGAYKHTEESKRKMSQSALLQSAKTKQKISESLKSHYKNKPGTFTGRKHSEETKNKIREKKIGSLLSEETKKKMSLSRTGQKRKEETKKKMSTSGLKKWKRLDKDPFRERMKKLSEQTVECPHCSKVTNKGNAKRWHFENCKRRVSSF